jgi:hypothetical protein
VDDIESSMPAMGYSDESDDSKDPAGSVRLPMVMFGLRAAALAGLAVAAGLGAGELFFDIDTTDVTTTTCCITVQ